MIFFTSDLHFCRTYKDKYRVGTRRFGSLQEKEAFLISRWNDVVGEADEVYVLGDFCEGDGRAANDVLRKLHGRKYLIIGNNDPYLRDPAFDPILFVWREHYAELLIDDTKLVLFHFPLEVWSGYNKDRIHLHGHMHRLRAVYEPIRRYEVGVDAHDGRPVSIDAVMEALKDCHNKNRSMPGDWG